MSTALILGGAGCIGSELAAQLLADGWKVRIIDNLSSGRREHLNGLDVEFHKDDLNLAGLEPYLAGVTQVWHLTAKTDIKNLVPGAYDFEADYRENLHATWRLLRAMRNCNVRRIAFASSAAVYGDQALLSEDLPLLPVSMYGATKLACEAILRAFALRDNFTVQCFRFCSIVSGKARTSGNMVMPDFIHKLKHDPTRLEIYGDGNQTKPSMHVSECAQAMRHVVKQAEGRPWTLMNIGVPDAVSVTRTAELVIEAMGLKDVKLEYTGGTVGWPGDVASFYMDVSKLKSWGFEAKMNSEQALRLAIKQLLEAGE